MCPTQFPVLYAYYLTESSLTTLLGRHYYSTLQKRKSVLQKLKKINNKWWT